MNIEKLTSLNLTQEQFQQIVEIEKNCGLEPYTPQMLMECIEEMDTYACLDGDKVAGFITIHASTRYLGGGVYIVNLNVAKPYRRKGIGEMLMKTACAYYKSTHAGRLITLDVTKTNTAAMKLYKKLGFQITDLPSGNGETDVVMVMPVDEMR